MIPTADRSFRTRNLEAESGASRAEAHECSAPGCSRATSHGKPFCVEHISAIATVQRFQRELARQARAQTPRRVGHAA